MLKSAGEHRGGKGRKGTKIQVKMVESEMMQQTPGSVSSASLSGYLVKRPTPHRRSRSILAMNTDTLKVASQIGGGNISVIF